jgi:hypothetical protein
MNNRPERGCSSETQYHPTDMTTATTTTTKSLVYVVGYIGTWVKCINNFSNYLKPVLLMYIFPSHPSLKLQL